MSNTYPTIEEVSKIVSNLNNGFNDYEYNTFGDKNSGEINLFSLTGNGDYLIVELLGQQVWNDEDDPRNWLEDEEGNELVIDGDGVKEDLEDYFRDSMKHLIYKLETYLLMGEE